MYVNEPLFRRETVEEFLARGGIVQRCPTKPAVSQLEGSVRVDGVTYTTIPGATEAIPQMSRSTLASYDKGLPEAIQPPQFVVWNEIARESMPGEIRQRLDCRLPDADEWDYTVTDHG